jgi:hypothetical protein
MTIKPLFWYTRRASEGVPERCPRTPAPLGYPRAEARVQTSFCCSVRSAAVRSKRTTPKHVLSSEGRSERGTGSAPLGLSFRFGMECRAQSGVSGDASRTTRLFALPGGAVCSLLWTAHHELSNTWCAKYLGGPTLVSCLICL